MYYSLHSNYSHLKEENAGILLDWGNALNLFHFLD